MLSGLNSTQPKTKLNEKKGTQERVKEKEDKESPKPKPCPAVQFKALQQEVNENMELSIKPKPKAEVILSRESGIEEEEPLTVGQLFKNAVRKFPKQPALKYKEDGKWKTFTYTQYYDLCIRAAKSFLKVRVGNTVAFWVETFLHHNQITKLENVLDVTNKYVLCHCSEMYCT